jgi:hypothetical protein
MRAPRLRELVIVPAFTQRRNGSDISLRLEWNRIDDALLSSTRLPRFVRLTVVYGIDSRNEPHLEDQQDDMRKSVCERMLNLHSLGKVEFR